MINVCFDIVRIMNTNDANDAYTIVENELITTLNECTKSYQSFENVLRIYLFQNYYQIVLWHVFHSFSVFYPDEPSDVLKANTKLLLNHIKSVSGCSSCGNNKNDTFANDCNLDNAVMSKTKMITFFNDYHKYINLKILHKTTNYESFTNDYIIAKYSNNEFNRYFENKCKFNLLHVLSDAGLTEQMLKKKFENFKIECSQQFKTKKISKIVFS